jgi:hypothetical protein
LTAISIGFVSLMLLPLVFIWLAVSVYSEPWKERAPEVLRERTEPQAAPPPPSPTPAEPAERPRTMAAGRRRPL